MDQNRRDGDVSGDYFLSRARAPPDPRRAASSEMGANRVKYTPIALFALFLITGIAHPNLAGDLLFPFSLIVPAAFALPYRIGLIGVLLAATVFLRRSDRYRRFWPVACSFTIFSFALFFDWYLTIIFGGFPGTPIGTVAAMLLSTVKVVAPVVVLVKLAGFSVSSTYLKRGNLKLGLIIGTIGFVIFLAIPFVTGNALFGGNVSLQTSAPLLPLALVFAFSNGLREELLYRGLFLNHFGSIFGKFPSNLLQGLVFSWSHSPVTYTSDVAVFLAILIPLSLIYGYLVQRTGALWSSILVHAGGDVSIALGMFSSLS